jgi:1-acyl-sn-glycerol-3-phosphate acyltransferase
MRPGTGQAPIPGFVATNDDGHPRCPLSEMPSAPPADLLPVGPRATLGFRFVRLWAEPLLHVVFRIRVEGKQNIPSQGNFIIIANHLAWLDPFLILSSFRSEPRVHFLGDTTILRTRRLQWWIVRMVGGYVPVNKQLHGDVKLFEHVDTCLQRGGVVALFPEGTTNGAREGCLLPFKKGFAHWALDNHLPVVPVVLSGTREVWLRKNVTLAIGPPLEPGGHTVESLVELAEQCLAAMLPPYVEPTGPKPLRQWLTHLF